MDITFDNKITVEEFNFLFESVGWGKLDERLVLKSIENLLFITTAVIDGKVIGLARVCGDGGYCIWVHDVIVVPTFQNKGIGKQLMQKAMNFIKNEFI